MKFSNGLLIHAKTNRINTIKMWFKGISTGMFQIKKKTTAY